MDTPTTETNLPALSRPFWSLARQRCPREISAPVRRALSRRAWLALLSTGIVLGCGAPESDRIPTYPVMGSITLKGQPIHGAFVALHPVEPQPGVPAPRAGVAPDGRLVVTTYDGGDGAPEGEYVLTIEWYKPANVRGELVPGPNVIPRKYSSPKTSDITIRVAAQENRLNPITL